MKWGKTLIFSLQAVFKRIGLRLPFTTFERELLTEVNVAPAQLHPNGWAFVKAFQILCGYLGIPPSVDVFLHFFEVKKQGKSLWVSFSGVASRISSPSSKTPSKVGRVTSSGCVAPSTTLQPWMASLYIGRRSPIRPNLNLYLRSRAESCTWP